MTTESDPGYAGSQPHELGITPDDVERALRALQKSGKFAELVKNLRWHFLNPFGTSALRRAKRTVSALCTQADSSLVEADTLPAIWERLKPEEQIVFTQLLKHACVGKYVLEYQESNPLARVLDMHPADLMRLFATHDDFVHAVHLSTRWENVLRLQTTPDGGAIEAYTNHYLPHPRSPEDRPKEYTHVDFNGVRLTPKDLAEAAARKKTPALGEPGVRTEHIGSMTTNNGPAVIVNDLG